MRSTHLVFPRFQKANKDSGGPRPWSASGHTREPRDVRTLDGPDDSDPRGRRARVRVRPSPSAPLGIPEERRQERERRGGVGGEGRTKVRASHPRVDVARPSLRASVEVPTRGRWAGRPTPGPLRAPRRV